MGTAESLSAPSIWVASHARSNIASVWRGIENRFQVRDIRDMEPTLEQMARSLAESGDYRVISRLEPQTEYHPPDNSPSRLSLHHPDAFD